MPELLGVSGVSVSDLLKASVCCGQQQFQSDGMLAHSELNNRKNSNAEPEAFMVASAQQGRDLQAAALLLNLDSVVRAQHFLLHLQRTLSQRPCPASLHDTVQQPSRTGDRKHRANSVL